MIYELHVRNSEKLLAAVCILEVLHTYQVASNLIPMCALITTFSFFFFLYPNFNAQQKKSGIWVCQVADKR